ncbi:MAG: di-trans,poly-cis-decaprenylcistransferase [Gemmatimonadetes bacterium]|nr:di-trans,poly-cis-decaprenylcistransferase [Gemmatimonadota bacterium]
MIQSAFPVPSGIHVAIIMDGNGRWAVARGRPREWGHRQGARAVRRVVEAAPDLGIGTLTLYAFSSDNWQRPAHEVRTLMRLFRSYLRREVPELLENGVRLEVLGRRDRLSPELVRAITAAETATAAASRLRLRLAVDYSSRDILVSAAQLAAAAGGANLDRDSFAARVGEAMGLREATPEVDLLIRTGGEQRLSDFLLWECAYAELTFTSKMWPEFGKDDLSAAVREFRARDRRFGKVTAAAG